MNAICPECKSSILLSQREIEVDTKQKRIEITAECVCGWTVAPNYKKWSHLHE